MEASNPRPAATPPSPAPSPPRPRGRAHRRRRGSHPGGTATAPRRAHRRRRRLRVRRGPAVGIDVDVLVGDLDSVSAEGLAGAEAGGVSVERHPVDKDRTDLDLALQRVVDDGFAECLVLGGGGGRRATSWATPPWSPPDGTTA